MKKKEKMNKLLIAFGLIILTVTLPCMSQSDDEFDDESSGADDGGDGSEGGDEYVTKGNLLKLMAKRKNALLTKRATTSVNRKLGADWTRISRGQTKVASVMINCIHALSKERTVASWNIRIVRLKKSLIYLFYGWLNKCAAVINKIRKTTNANNCRIIL
ncbi:hypothetical protein QQG55_14670 [Brugia pahangi]